MDEKSIKRNKQTIEMFKMKTISKNSLYLVMTYQITVIGTEMIMDD